MTYDPFQTSSVMGGYGTQNPFQLPYAGVPTMNPATAFNPLAQNPFAQNPLAQILAARAAVIAQLLGATGLTNPMQALTQNPLLAVGLESQLLNPILGHSQFGQQHLFNPQIGQGVPQFGQPGSIYGQTPQTLAPQSWVGQQGHPWLSQLAGRGFYGPGISPWAGF